MSKKKKNKVRAKYIAARAILVGVSIVFVIMCAAICTVK